MIEVDVVDKSTFISYGARLVNKGLNYQTIWQIDIPVELLGYTFLISLA